MNQTKRRKIAKSGGIAAHKQGKAHEFTKSEAIAAGRKGRKGRTQQLTKKYS